MTDGIGCDRCSRIYAIISAEDDSLIVASDGEWNVEFSKGRIVGLICPACQTPEENAEAEIRYATTDYSRAVLGEDRRWRAPMKG